jgi:TM2 domain-containing membrane protein YozV
VNEVPKVELKEQVKPKAAKKEKEEKDPAIAALISVVGMLILGAPSLGYFYIDNVRKGIIYLALTWGVAIAAVLAYYAGMFTIVGIVCCLPLLLVPLAFELYIVWAVYLEAQGKKSELPDL